jgi:photosystem II stability/assembly factor-like uncharacterized protein
LWTADVGATWRNITPPALTQTQLQTAAIAVQPDGHQWVALAPTAGSTSVTVMRRASTTQAWATTSVPLGPLSISPDAAVTMSLSFVDATNGWLLVGEQITQFGYGELLHTTDAGATWTLQAGQSALPTIGTLHFVTRQLGYLDATMTGTWWATRDAGKSWAQLDLPVPASKKADAVNVLGTPGLARNAIVLAASFTTPGVGDADGIGIFRSTDNGATWSVLQLPSAAPTEQYHFATTSNGSSYLLLRAQPAQDFQAFTWVTSRSTNGGTSFTDSSSVHNFYPGPLTVADADNLWTLGGANGCKSFKSDCWNTTGLIASNNGGSTWHQVKLPT